MIIKIVRVTGGMISCEKKIDASWVWFTTTRKTCYMQTKTINSKGFVISPADSSIDALTFYTNKKILFLPIRVDETFTNLIGYEAADCSLTAVSKINFKNLDKLLYLGLMKNQIERISSDTFEDLTSLEILVLGLLKNIF